MPGQHFSFPDCRSDIFAFMTSWKVSEQKRNAWVIGITGGSFVANIISMATHGYENTKYGYFDIT